MAYGWSGYGMRVNSRNQIGWMVMTFTDMGRLGEEEIGMGILGQV